MTVEQAVRLLALRVRRMGRRIAAALKSGPPLEELLPNTPEECEARILTIQTGPYSPESKRFAILLLDARKAALTARRQREYDAQRPQPPVPPSGPTLGGIA